MGIRDQAKSDLMELGTESLAELLLTLISKDDESLNRLLGAGKVPASFQTYMVMVFDVRQRSS